MIDFKKMAEEVHGMIETALQQAYTEGRADGLEEAARIARSCNQDYWTGNDKDFFLHDNAEEIAKKIEAVAKK